MKIKGEGTYVEMSGQNHIVKGAVDLPDGAVLQSLNVSGKLLFDKISCDKIDVKGKCEGDSLVSKNVTLEGKSEIRSLQIEQTLRAEGTIKSDSVKAQEIIFNSRASSVDNIKCKKIKIYSDDVKNVPQASFADIFKGHVVIRTSEALFRIKNLDADEIDLENCEVDEITCTYAVIGANCVIGKLNVAGKCEVVEGAKIGEIIHTKPVA